MFSSIWVPHWILIVVVLVSKKCNCLDSYSISKRSTFYHSVTVWVKINFPVSFLSFILHKISSYFWSSRVFAKFPNSMCKVSYFLHLNLTKKKKDFAKLYIVQHQNTVSSNVDLLGTVSTMCSKHTNMHTLSQFSVRASWNFEEWFKEKWLETVLGIGIL